MLEVPPVMGGEDFARYGRQEPRVPSHMFKLGSVAPDVVKQAKVNNTSLPSLHSAFFAPEPKPTIKTGIKAMTAVVVALLPVPDRDRQ